MPTTVNWNGTSYDIPNAGELNWADLSNFLVALGTNAQSTQDIQWATREDAGTTISFLATDTVLVCTALAARTVNMPAGADGKIAVIKDAANTAATANITINRDGTDVFDGGATSATINDNSGVSIFVFENGVWRLIATGATDTGPNFGSQNVVTTGGMGVGTSSLDGKLHVYSADAGTITTDTNADDLIIEGGATAGITLRTNGTSVGRIKFAAPDADNNDMTIDYFYPNETLTFNDDGGTTVFSVRGDTNRVGVGNSNPSTDLDVTGTTATDSLAVNQTSVTGGYVADFNGSTRTAGNVLSQSNSPTLALYETDATNDDDGYHVSCNNDVFLIFRRSNDSFSEMAACVPQGTGVGAKPRWVFGGSSQDPGSATMRIIGEGTSSTARYPLFVEDGGTGDLFYVREDGETRVAGELELKPIAAGINPKIYFNHPTGGITDDDAFIQVSRTSGDMQLATGDTVRLTIDGSTGQVTTAGDLRVTTQIGFGLDNPTEMIHSVTGNTGSQQLFIDNGNALGNAGSIYYNNNNDYLMTRIYGSSTGASDVFGTTSQGSAHVVSTCDRLMIGTVNSAPLNFGTNNTIALQFATDQTMFATNYYSNLLTGTTRDGYVKSNGEIGYISSLRAYKKDIADITDVAWLHSLQPRSFVYKTVTKNEDGTKSISDDSDGGTQYGLIAEEVEPVNNLICEYNTESNDLEGVAYRKLIVPMLKEIQNLRAEVDALKNP